MAHKTSRYKFNLNVDKEISKESKLYKKIALDLILNLNFNSSIIKPHEFWVSYSEYFMKLFIKKVRQLSLLSSDAETLLNKVEERR